VIYRKLGTSSWSSS